MCPLRNQQPRVLRRRDGLRAVGPRDAPRLTPISTVRRTLVWYRGKELRLTDHAPLADALAAGDEIIPLFVLDPFYFAPERAAALPHRMQYLLDALEALAANFERKGSRLIVVAGKSVEVVPRLARAWKVDRVVAQRWSEPFGRERDRRIAAALSAPLELFEGETLYPPGSIRSGAGAPYAVFTPFARALGRGAPPPAPLAAPKRLPPPPKNLEYPPAAIPTLESLGLARNPALIAGGERAARARMRSFLEGPAGDYAAGRDRMDRDGTSRLSADLKFGTLSVRELWHASELATDNAGGRAFRNELLWREFAHHALWDRPELLKAPFRPEFRDFPWRDDADDWTAWATGRTGIPVVDAAARQLLAEGFVHNRARMIAACFLTKHLLIDYRRGEAHYLKYLVDGDWAANNLGWQWAAGCGCDAQPWFRVFNPVTQGEKFDPDGAYVKRWVPELARLPAPKLHAPWRLSDSALREAGVILGKTYPHPIVELKQARERYLAVVKAHLARR